MNIDILNKLECILKELSSFEKMGLDTSSLKIFIKNYKNFLTINEQAIEQLSLDEKLSVKDMIKILLSEKGAKKDIGKRDFYIILNQVDNEVLLQYAMEISSVLNKYGIQIALTKYKI